MIEVHAPKPQGYRMLLNQAREKLWEQIVVVIPIVAYLLLFKVVILGLPLDLNFSIVVGIVCVIVGLVFFMDGLRFGIMPLGESLGTLLPRHLPQKVILAVAWVLGMGVTFAEPAIGALQTLGSLVSCNQAPYLHLLLNVWTLQLILAIGTGVGLAAVVGILRLLRDWSIKPVIYISVALTLGLSIIVKYFSNVSEIIGLAWDCGAVTTGPVTVPVVIALGIGLAQSSGREESPLAGFGIVTLASLYPIKTVLLLGLYLGRVYTREQIIEAHCIDTEAVELTPDMIGIDTAGPDAAWYEHSPYNEVVLGVRAVVPLMGFLLYLNHYIQRKEAIKRGDLDLGSSMLVELGSFPKRGGDYQKVCANSPDDALSATPERRGQTSEISEWTIEPGLELPSPLVDSTEEPPMDLPRQGSRSMDFEDRDQSLAAVKFKDSSQDDSEVPRSGKQETRSKRERTKLRRWSLPDVLDVRNSRRQKYKEFQRVHARRSSTDDSFEIEFDADDEQYGNDMQKPVQEWTVYGLWALLAGLLLFNEGLTYGLNRMGSETGMMIPAAFAKVSYLPDTPRYGYATGVLISICFAFILGIGATLAEPALRVLGEKVEELTNGSMRATLVVRSVAAGVASGVSLGVIKIIYSLDIMHFLMPLYPIACILTYYSREEVVNVAWDSAGVTTSEVTVPIVLSLGLGVGNALNASDGFGILTLASICPIISVLTSGLVVQLRESQQGEYHAVSTQGEL